MRSRVLVTFDPENLDPKQKKLQPLRNAYFKCQKGDSTLLVAILESHGLTQVSCNTDDFSLIWTGSHLKPDKLTSLKSHQRINHFPRSYELTRKDRLYKNIQRKQSIHGFHNFDFVPLSFILPLEFKELMTASHRVRTPWIVKPVASSRGRGIYLTHEPSEVSLDEPVIVSKYIDNPLLLDGNKCDLRLYVLVTSYDPLIIYLYREGLVRCATVKYTSGSQNLDNPCVHLCNYSINKYHSNFRTSPDLGSEDGHKRSLSSFLRNLNQTGRGAAQLMASIEDLIVKTILSASTQIAIATKMFTSDALNCFELYGFDILVDSLLKPWLLEVNFSPSLGCDTAIDKQIKSALLCDMLNLVGIEEVGQRRFPEVREDSVKRKDTLKKEPRRRSKSSDSRARSLTPDGANMLRFLEEQNDRRGDFVRIFPTEHSWSKYCEFIDSSPLPLNKAMHELLYPEVERIKATAHRKKRREYQEIPLTPQDLERLAIYNQPFSRGYMPKRKAASKTPAPAIKVQEPVPGETSWVQTLYQELKTSMSQGSRLSSSQARKAFSRYLNCILQRLPGITEETNGNRQLALVEKFLRRVTLKQRISGQIATNRANYGVEDRLAFLANQLRAFIEVVERESRDSTNNPTALDSEIFDGFCNVAGEAELEELLSLHTELEPDCSLQFLFGKKFSDHERIPLPLVEETGKLDLLKKACSSDGARRRSTSRPTDEAKDGKQCFRGRRERFSRITDLLTDQVCASLQGDASTKKKSRRQ